MGCAPAELFKMPGITAGTSGISVRDLTEGGADGRALPAIGGRLTTTDGYL